jgi:glycosyltransferase involved in cell wall biosynthesis
VSTTNTSPEADTPEATVGLDGDESPSQDWTPKLKVLIWGTAHEGPCAYHRGDVFTSPLRENHDIELRSISSINYKPALGWEDKDPLLAFESGKMEVDVEPIEWADVIVFRRYYNTALKCGEYRSPQDPGCGFSTLDEDEAAAHEHWYKRQDDITRVLWPQFRDHWTGGIIYETDDDHFNIKPWNGYYKDVVHERSLIEDMARRADLVTVATPALTKQYGRFGPPVRVIRNAIDPDLYIKDAERPDDPRARLVYYGSTARIRDYGGRLVTGNRADGNGYALRAVEENRHRLTRVFLGTNEGSEQLIARWFDEQTPYIVGIAQFAKALTNTYGDIGIAPLGGDEFDRAKSELHWLEYTLSDMAFIGERFSGGGPYQVIRPGVDGLLARGAQEWYDSVKKLATSPDLRADLVGRAKERVLAEYDYRVRAAEWADAFWYAFEHARGALQDAA